MLLREILQSKVSIFGKLCIMRFFRFSGLCTISSNVTKHWTPDLLGCFFFFIYLFFLNNVKCINHFVKQQFQRRFTRQFLVLYISWLDQTECSVYVSSELFKILWTCIAVIPEALWDSIIVLFEYHLHNSFAACKLVSHQE